MATKAPLVEIGTDNVHRWSFESATDLITFAFDREAGRGEDGRITANNRMTAYEKSGSRYSCYHTIASIQAAIERPRPTIARAVADFKKRIEDIVDAPTVTRRKRRHGLEDGDELDPLAVLYRHPEGWSDTLRERQQKPVIRIGINTSCLADEDESRLLYRGAAGAALADIFTDRGHAVEVVMFKAATGMSDDIDDYLFTVPVKRSDAPLDMALIATVVADVGFMRLVCLNAVARMARKREHAGIGFSRSISEVDRAGFDFVIDRDANTLELAVAYVMKAMAALKHND